MLLPEISIRSHSSDQFVIDRVLYSNSYRLNRFIPDCTVVDIGAHIGAFSLASIIHGASKIYAFEPSQFNYRVLVKNLSDFSKDFSVFQLGVDSTSGFKFMSKPQMVKSSFIEFASLAISASEEDYKTDKAYFVNLDEVLSMIEEDIYLLKISVSGAEFKLLNDSKRLSLVKNLCYETNCSEEEAKAMIDEIKKKGSFKDALFEKVGEKTYLFLFSKEDHSICFSKYRTV